MIDTDEYEGHMDDYYFEGSNFDLKRLIMYDSDGNEIAVLKSKNKELMGGPVFVSPTIEIMVAAPKLLAEVKRLRGLLDAIIDITLKELKIFDDNCPMINIRDLAYKGILWGNKE